MEEKEEEKMQMKSTYHRVNYLAETDEWLHEDPEDCQFALATQSQVATKIRFIRYYSTDLPWCTCSLFTQSLL